jgi:hypothetical protein
MGLSELRKILADRGVHPDAVSIEGANPRDGGQYRLERSGKTWVTYAYERGDMIELREFSGEDEACDYFLKWVQKDPTIWRRKAD